jgi:SAM-dependent methyltransferase
MAFRTFADTAEAAAYVASLDERWPDRSLVKAHLSRRLGPWTVDAPRVVEFCSGAGALAGQILADHPAVHFTGIDASPTLLALARADLAHYSDRAMWVEADLNGDEWPTRLPGPVDAFVSLQSLHDLGDAAAVGRIVRLAAAHLAPGGQFVYADLLPDPAPDAKPNPGRLPVERHLALLAEAGFSSAQCTLKVGPFGCFWAQRA